MSEEAIENKLGTKITTLREAHHLTQQDLADRCQCDIETTQGIDIALAAIPQVLLRKIWPLYTSPSPRDRTSSRMTSSA